MNTTPQDIPTYPSEPTGRTNANDPAATYDEEVEAEFARAFSAAVVAFRNSLPDSEKDAIDSNATLNAVIQYVSSRADDASNGKGMPRGLSWLCSAINTLGSGLEPYFACISSLVLSNPEIAGLFWGSLQFLFKVSGARLSVSHSSSIIESLNALLLISFAETILPSWKS